MSIDSTNKKHRVMFIPHGGGPMPIMGHPSHTTLTAFLKEAASELVQPKTIFLITAHWEADPIAISTAAWPSMLFDYSGFPPETYKYIYPAPGNPELARQLIDALGDASITAQADDSRGFDHGTFIPLMLMYSEATIPVIQISLHPSLSPKAHIQIGEVIGKIAKQHDGIVIGSGLSFHNIQAQFSNMESGQEIKQATQFDAWLKYTLSLNVSHAEEALIHWASAPSARFSHPREEHLIPLHVCFGAAKAQQTQLETVFTTRMMGAQVSAFAG